jgi:acid phosphatase (class A)
MRLQTPFLAILLAGSALSVIASGAMAQTLTTPSQPASNAAPRAAKPAPQLIYLSPEFLSQPGLILPVPPTPESAEGKADLAAAKAMQAAASPERIAQAAYDDGHETVWVFGDVLPGFDEAKLPMTAKLFAAARNDQNIEGNVFKAYFARVRPFDVDHSIKTCVPSVYGKVPRSYPSGHATLGYSLGIVLANLIPEKADVILARAHDYANSRVICGVHYPSDLTASQVLATAIALEWMRTPAFRKDYDAAKAELIAAGLTK